MLTKQELLKYKEILAFNLGQVEKDYLQHIFLLFLTKNIGNEMLFKGGTALQKAYGLNRFSEDLDFTLKESTLKINEVITKITKSISMFGFETTAEEVNKKDSLNYRLWIKGPLYDGSERSLTTIRIEISLRNDIYMQPEIKEIISIYEDIQPYIIALMNPNEILSEKVRAVYKRDKARDLYDLWFLLKKGFKLDNELINKKLSIYNLKHDNKKLNSKINEAKSIWEKELQGYIAIIPKFETVAKETKDLLNKQLNK